MNNALILHPFKPFRADLYNCLSHEMMAMKDLLGGHADLWDGSQDVHDYAQLYIFGHGPGVLPFDLAPYKGQIYYILGDPDFSVLHEVSYPKEHFQYKIKVLSCYPQYLRMREYLLGKYKNSWLPAGSKYLPLWPSQFVGMAYSNRFARLPEQPTYGLVYVGHNRSMYRDSRLCHFMDTDLYSTASFSAQLNCARHSNFSRISTNYVFATSRKAKATIVTGEPCYQFLSPYPQRLLQAWACGVMAFVDSEVFPKDLFMQTFPMLDCMYVDGPDCIHAMLFKEDLEGQQHIIQTQYKYLTQLSGLLYLEG